MIIRHAWARDIMSDYIKCRRYPVRHIQYVDVPLPPGGGGGGTHIYVLYRYVQR